jgi:hypothetical protein
MLTTTFLLATAIATILALGGMLFIRKPDDQQVHLGAGSAVVALACVLTALGLALL